MTRQSAVFAKCAAAFALLFTATACATLLRTGLSKAGVEDRTSESIASAGSEVGTMSPSPRTAADARPGDDQASVYEQMPTPRIWRLGLGYPHSVAYGATRWLAQGPCNIMPRGIADVLPVPEGAPATEMFSWGTVHVDAFGMPGVFFNGLVRQDGSSLTGQMMAETARQAAYGQGCGFNVFLGVRFGSVPAGGQPIRVLRE